MNVNHPRYGKQRKAKDLTGMTFGKYTVMKRAENRRSPNGKSIVMWTCKCECGIVKDVPASGLLNGSQRSCGCARGFYASESRHSHSKNTFDLSGVHGIGHTPKGHVFLFDKDDFEAIRTHTWEVNNTGYISTQTYRNKTSKGYLLHRVVMNVTDSKIIIDHINGNPKDNRKRNLRIVTQSQNSMNASISKSNKSGVKGVSWSKSKKKWYATIGVNNKTINLGTYELFDDAVNARIDAEGKYFGEYSFLNRPTNDQLESDA